MTKDESLIVIPGQDAKDAQSAIAEEAFDFGETQSELQMNVFALDVSGSMQSSVSAEGHGMQKIELLKKALERYINQRFQKHPSSRVGLVAFESYIHVLIEITDNEQELIAEARGLTAGGGTAMHKGLTRAISMLDKNKGSYIPRIILISDGAPDSPEAVVDVIESNKEKRIIVDCIYIGERTEYDSNYIDFMKNIAKITGGIFEHITSEKEFEQKFLKVADRPLLGAGTPDVDAPDEKGTICL